MSYHPSPTEQAALERDGERLELDDAPTGYPAGSSVATSRGCGSTAQAGSTEMTPLVFIATVPWRSENLKALLAIVEPQAQTIVLHGVPPGARWREASKHSGLAIVLDDDHLVDAGYVARCVATYARLKAPFAWAGHGRNGVYVTHDKARTHDVELVDLAAGHAVVPTAMLDRLEDDPQADFYLGYDGHDEAFVSWHLRARGARLWRPAGPSGITCVRSLHHDKRSQWRLDPGKYARLRAEIAKRPQVGAKVDYYAGTTGKITEVRMKGQMPLVSVSWDNGAPDLGPYPIGTPTAAVSLAV